MKRLDMKSFICGMVFMTIGITTIYGAGKIKSATYSNSKILLNGSTVPLENSLVEIVNEGKVEREIYVHVKELAEFLGYDVQWNNKDHSINLVDTFTVSVSKAEPNAAGNAVISVKSNTHNVSDSGSFTAKSGQTLTLNIESDIAGGTVDLFLFDPSGKEQRITIGATNATKEIKLSEGTWQYNCSGIFKSGTFKMVGMVR